jgi:hypothetical protein
VINARTMIPLILSAGLSAAASSAANYVVKVEPPEPRNSFPAATVSDDQTSCYTMFGGGSEFVHYRTADRLEIVNHVSKKRTILTHQAINDLAAAAKRRAEAYASGQEDLLKSAIISDHFKALVRKYGPPKSAGNTSPIEIEVTPAPNALSFPALLALRAKLAWAREQIRKRVPGGEKTAALLYCAYDLSRLPGTFRSPATKRPIALELEEAAKTNSVVSEKLNYATVPMSQMFLNLGSGGGKTGEVGDEQ